MLAGLPIQKKLAIAVFALCSFFVGFVVLGIVPLIQKIEIQQREIQGLTTQINEAESLDSQLADERGLLKAAIAQNDQYREFIAPHVTEATILEWIGRKAALKNIELAMIQPRTDTVSGKKIHLPSGERLRQSALALQFRGTFSEIGTFLGALNHWPFLANVESFALSLYEESSGSLEIEVEIKAFLLDGSRHG